MGANNMPRVTPRDSGGAPNYKDFVVKQVGPARPTPPQNDIPLWDPTAEDWDEMPIAIYIQTATTTTMRLVIPPGCARIQYQTDGQVRFRGDGFKVHQGVKHGVKAVVHGAAGGFREYVIIDGAVIIDVSPRNIKKKTNQPVYRDISMENVSGAERNVCIWFMR